MIWFSFWGFVAFEWRRGLSHFGDLFYALFCPSCSGVCKEAKCVVFWACWTNILNWPNQTDWVHLNLVLLSFVWSQFEFFTNSVFSFFNFDSIRKPSWPISLIAATVVKSRTKNFILWIESNRILRSNRSPKINYK